MADQEVSMSIEETNKLRAALGLKPLRVGPAKESTPAEDEKKKEEERKQKEQEQRDAEALARLEKVKAKRAITAKIQGSALGEELANDAELDDAAAWVARQKQKAQDTSSTSAAAAPAARPAKRERREEPSSSASSRSKYDEKDIKDLKVGHKFENIQEGETLILTLADAPVLDSKTHQMSDAADVLENVNIRDKERMQKIEDEKKKIKSGRVYDPYAEQKSILSQYDEEEERVTFSLGSAVAEAAAPSRDEVKARLASMPTVSLGDAKTVASEYMTAEEVKFKAAKPKKIVRKKKTSALVKELEEAAAAEGAAADHGSRTEVLAERQAEEAAAKAERARVQRENYAKAQEKATAASATLLPPPPAAKKAAAAVVVKKEARKDDDDVFKDEAEEEMLAAVNAARAAAATQVVRPQDIAEQVLARRAVKKEEEETKANEVTFSTTTEFLRAVNPVERESAAAVAAKSAARAAAAAAAAEAKAMEVDEGSAAPEGAAAAAAEEESSRAAKGGGDEESSEGALPAEPMVGRSMAAALQYVQTRGHALEKDMEVYSGRKADKAIKPEEQGPGEVRLMYVDEFGMQMTPKEAWRHMCHAFHGKHPSKNKREKMLKRREAMLEAKKAGGSADIVSQVETMLKTQEKLQTPYIVVSSSTPAPLIAAAAHAAKPAAASAPVKIESFSLKGKAAKK